MNLTPIYKIETDQMTFAVRAAGARATPVRVWEGAFEPEIKVWDTVLSYPWCKMIIMSP